MIKKKQNKKNRQTTIWQTHSYAGIFWNIHPSNDGNVNILFIKTEAGLASYIKCSNELQASDFIVYYWETTD